MMNGTARTQAEGPPLGIGYYTAPEAARLLGVAIPSVNRWLGGYTYQEDGQKIVVSALWEPELPKGNKHIELSFRDLIELRFIVAFTRAGLGLKTIRNCLEYARECVEDDRPFSTRRFKTDGRTIFLESLRKSGDAELLDLKSRQFAFRQIIERSFKDLDIEDSTVVRWRPYNGKRTIVIDPDRAFGQPISADYGVPTVVLSDAVLSEGSIDRVSKIYELPASVVQDAVRFEESLNSREGAN